VVAGRASDPAISYAPWRLFSIGNSHPVEVLDRLIEQEVGRPAIREFLPMQPGDVVETCADSADLEGAIRFRPNTTIEAGTRLFVGWLIAYRRSAVSTANARSC
jgi:UDP-glucuronate 4-epimerase